MKALYPPIVDGKSIYDMDSGKYLKMWQGPQHPGVTGNMSLELDICGDQIISCKTHVGYLHRGFEKLMERRRYINCFPIVCRICVPEPDTNEYLFAAAVEELLGIEIPERAKWLRTLNMELSRLASFLMWIGGQSGAFGMGTVPQWALAHRDFVLDLFEEWTYARIYHMYMIPGGVRGEIPEGWEEHTRQVMDNVEKLLEEIRHVMLNNGIFKMRAQGLGIVTAEMVDRFGAVGPVARGSGMKRDVRKDSPYLAYDQLDFEVVTETAGDAYARTLVRWREMHQSISLIRQILDKMPREGEFYTTLPNILHLKVPAGETYVRAESTRGEYGYYIVSDGTPFPRKVTVRGPSYCHAMSLLEHLAVGTNIADTHGLMLSLHTYPPEIER
ncbi:MAG: NADH-quinone oxidoreductase subunit D [Candidatus Cloacimonadaceae bacterium]|nr:NADH-quinone oxidoreductase subunit D [Candidatus Cloacimonadaceae bacterium]MDP3114341.1 NADH-quinone oxidoreductase subunit D [Candidatus Cloacimonadaceae bacterium]